MGGETRLSVMLRGLVLVLPLVVFLAENTDAVETLVDAEATLGVVAGVGGNWASIPGLKFPGAAADLSGEEAPSLAACQEFCSERSHCFAVSYSRSSEECFWASHTLDYDSDFTLYAQNEDGGSFAFPGVKQLDDPLSVPQKVSKQDCDKGCAAAADTCKSYSYSPGKGDCFFSKQGVMFDPKFVYFEKNSAQDLERISRNLREQAAKASNFHNELKMKNDAIQMQRELTEKDKAAEAHSTGIAQEHKAKEDQKHEAAQESAAKKADAAKVKAEEDAKRAAVKKEAKQKLDAWQKNKELTTERFNKALAAKNKQAEKVARSADELKILSRQLEDAVKAATVSRAVASKSALTGDLNYMKGLADQKPVSPPTEEEMNARVIEAESEIKKRQVLLEELKKKMEMAQNGKKTEEFAKLEGRVSLLRGDLEGKDSQYKVTPTPELDQQRLAIQKKLRDLESKMLEISRVHNVPAYKAQIKKTEEEIVEWTAGLKKAKEALRVAVDLPVIPEMKGVEPPQGDPIAALAEERKDPACKNATSVKLIKAGEVEEAAGDKVTAALGDLAEGKGEIAKEELKDAKGALGEANKNLEESAKAALKDNPATVMSKDEEIKHKVSEGTSVSVAALESDRDEKQKVLAGEEKVLQKAIKHMMLMQEKMELAAAYSEQEKNAAKEKIQERKAKAEMAAKETAHKIAKEKADKKEKGIKSEQKAKQEENMHKEKASKESAAKKQAVEVAAKAKESKVKLEVETPAAAQVTEKEKETEIRIEKLKSKERQDKMQHILEALKANNNHPEERKKWEQKLAELKPMMSSSQAKLAEAEHEQLVAQREVQVAKEQEEKQAAEKTKKAEDKAVALEAQMAADKKATELAQEEIRRANRALEEQVRLAAMMTSAESKSKGEAKVEELKEKDREKSNKIEEKQQRLSLAKEQENKLQTKAKNEKEKGEKIKATNQADREQEEARESKFKQIEEQKRQELHEQKQRIAKAQEQQLKDTMEKSNKAHVATETAAKNKVLNQQRAESNLVYSEFANRYQRKIKVASDHEAKQKYAVKAPYDMESNNKAEIGTKAARKERGVKVEARGKKEMKQKDTAEKNDKSRSKEKLDKMNKKADEKAKKKERADKKVERQTKTEERADKAKEAAEKSKNAAAKEKADKAKKEAQAKKEAAAAKAKKIADEQAAANEGKNKVHERMLALADGFPKTRMVHLRFSRLGRKVTQAKMAPSPRVNVAKVGDLCTLGGVVKIPDTSGKDPTGPMLAQLPETCWPNRRLIFNQPRVEDGTAVQNVRVDVLVTGAIIAVTNNDGGAVISMDGIHFSPQGSSPMTESQERVCKGWKKPKETLSAIKLPEPPVSKLSWVSHGCWFDGGPAKKGATELSLEFDENHEDLGEADDDDDGARRRGRRRRRRRRRREKKEKAKQAKVEAAKKESEEKATREKDSKTAAQEKGDKKKKKEDAERAEKQRKENEEKNERAAKDKKERATKEAAAKVEKEKADKETAQKNKEKKQKKDEKVSKERATKRLLKPPLFTPANTLGYDNKKYQKKKDPVRECAMYAAKKNIPLFSVENGGFCNFQMSPNQNYNKFGHSDACSQGTGGKTSMNVYEVQDFPERIDDLIENKKTEIDSLGCFRLTEKSKVVDAVKIGYSKDKKTYWKTAVKSCAAFAKRKKFKYFSVGKGGHCYTGKDHGKNYAAQGKSTQCKDGRGDKWAQSVYRIQKRLPYDINNPSATNVALGRPTTQTSIADKLPSWGAVDGNLTHCAATQPASKGKHNQWQVSLLNRADVQAVQIFSSESRELKDFAVHVSDTTFYQNTPTCGLRHKLGKKSSITINCEHKGQYVYIVGLDSEPLNICEVRVFTGAKPVKAEEPPPPPPPPPKPRSFGSRRRSAATSYKPKGKKMMSIEPLKLENKWKNANIGYGAASVKSQGYFCILSGLIQGPSFGVVADLPTGCRPKKTLAFLQNNHLGNMKITVNPQGEVMWAGGSQENKWISLNGIIFSTSPYHRKIKLKNGWMAFDTQKYPEASFVVENRLCVLGGFVFAGKFDVVGVLGPECRPKYLKVYNAATGPDLDKLARINIYPDGRIMWAGGQQDDAFLSFNGISFTTQRYKKPRLVKDMSLSSTVELQSELVEDDSELDEAVEL